MPSKNPYRTDIARFDVFNGPLFEVYTLAQNPGTRVSVMGGALTGRYQFEDARDAMAWVLVQTGWDMDLDERTAQYHQNERADDATEVKD